MDLDDAILRLRGRDLNVHVPAVDGATQAIRGTGSIYSKFKICDWQQFSRRILPNKAMPLIIRSRNGHIRPSMEPFGLSVFAILARSFFSLSCSETELCLTPVQFTDRTLL